MGKKYTAEDVDNAYRNGVEHGAAVQRALSEENSEPQSGEKGIQQVQPEHGEYTLTVRYKHTKYATDDSDFTTALVKELAEDEFRFVTDHFDVLSVSVDAY